MGMKWLSAPCVRADSAINDEIKEKRWLMAEDRPATEIAAIQERLQALDQERQQLLAWLGVLERTCVEQPKPAANKPAVAISSSAAEKIALFRATGRKRCGAILIIRRCGRWRTSSRRTVRR